MAFCEIMTKAAVSLFVIRNRCADEKTETVSPSIKGYSTSRSPYVTIEISTVENAAEIASYRALFVQPLTEMP